MIGPADLEAWCDEDSMVETQTSATASARPSADDRWRNRNEAFLRLATGRPLSLTEWRNLRSGLFGR